MSCSWTLQHDGPGTVCFSLQFPKKDAKKQNGKPPQITGRSLFLLAQSRSPKKCRWFNRTWSFFVQSWGSWTGLKKGNYCTYILFIYGKIVLCSLAFRQHASCLEDCLLLAAGSWNFSHIQVLLFRGNFCDDFRKWKKRSVSAKQRGVANERLCLFI